MKTLGPEDVQFRKLVESLDGRQESVAEALGVSRLAITHRLLSEKHFKWWSDFKAQRARKRHQLRAQRHYARRKQRVAEAEALLHGGKAAEAVLLRAMMEELTGD
jgi:hypothetical protein